MLPRLQRELGMNLVLTAASILFAAGSAALALVRSPAIVFVRMLVAGVGWVGVRATLSIITRTVLPAWVRARATGVYPVVFSGGQAIRALIWGVIAQAASTEESLLIAAALLLAGAATVIPLPPAAARRGQAGHERVCLQA